MDQAGLEQFVCTRLRMLLGTGAMNSESANKFISALVKALQTLCHGYVEFNDGIEIIGHIYLNIDSGSSFDYVVKEKLCKNAENSTVFVSKSFQAQAPADCSSRKDRDDGHTGVFEDSSMSPTSGTSRIQSAINSISNVLSGAPESHKSRLLEHSSHHSSSQNTGKRKRENNGSYSNMQPPFKYTTLQTTSSSSSSYFSGGPPSKQETDRNHSEHFSSASRTEYFGGDSNQSSGMGPDDEDDLHLDVTFVKEEYESQRNSSHRGVSANASSRLSQDLSSNHSNMPRDGGGTLSFSSSHHPLPQQFASGTAGDTGSVIRGFQDTLPTDVDQQTGQRPPNPRNPAAIDVSKVWSQHFVTAPAGAQIEGGRQIRSFNCPICGLLIIHRKNVRRHMRKHTGEMFFCDLCDWRGTCRWKLQKHREKKHAVLPIAPEIVNVL